MKEQFQLQQAESVERETVGIRAGNVLVPVRDYNTLNHLKWVLERTDTREQDVVVMTARISQFGTAAYGLSTEQVFSDYEQTLFTRAVSVAESFGKKISLLVVPARDPWSAIAQTAHNLESSAVVAGVSSKMTPAEQAFNLGSAWEAIPEPKRQFLLQIVQPDGIRRHFPRRPAHAHHEERGRRPASSLMAECHPGTGFGKRPPPRHSDRGPYPLRPRLSARTITKTS